MLSFQSELHGHVVQEVAFEGQKRKMQNVAFPVLRILHNWCHDAQVPYLSF